MKPKTEQEQKEEKIELLIYLRIARKPDSENKVAGHIFYNNTISRVKIL
jgi:hypothetical protein